jgi:hypothetical protein
MRAPVCDGDGSAVCAGVGGLVLRARPEPEALNRASPCPSAWTECGFGAQVFYAASAFNANIGAWNTARVTTLLQVCAAPGPAARTMAGRARPGLRCGAARCAQRHRRCACACAHVSALACVGHFYVCAGYMLTYSIHLSVYVRIGRGYECVHQCAMVTDRLCARALAGSCCGLGLNPKPSTVRALARRRGLSAASARRRSTRRRRSTPTSARGTPRGSPRCPMYAPLPARRRALWRMRSAGAAMQRGPLCAAAPPMRARVRTRAGTRLRGALGVGTAARRGGSMRVSEYRCIQMGACVCYAFIHTISIYLYM